VQGLRSACKDCRNCLISRHIALAHYFRCNLWILQKLELSNNKIRSMDGLHGHKYLEMIDLEENKVRFLATNSHFYCTWSHGCYNNQCISHSVQTYRT